MECEMWKPANQKKLKRVLKALKARIKWLKKDVAIAEAYIAKIRAI